MEIVKVNMPEPTPEAKKRSIYKVDLSKKVMKPEVILEKQDFESGSVNPNNCILFSAGNFSVVIGKSKAKKTFLNSLLASMVISGEGKYGFNPVKSDTAIFDTEQSDYDAWKVGNRIKRLSGVSEFNMFKLRDMSHRERYEFISDYMEAMKPRFVVIDGIADLVFSINEESEANKIQEFLLKITKQINCHVMCVLHQNKGDNYATGFLGSMLMKKAELVISIAKFHNTKMSQVKCDFIRGSKEFEPFLLDVKDGLPVIIDSEDAKGNEPKFES